MINNIRRLVKIPLLVHFFSWMIPSILELLSKSIVMAVVITTLPKEDFGLVSIAMLVFSYSVLLQFGASDALRLHLPSLYAKNNLDEISNQLNIALTFSVQNIILASLLSLTLLFAADQSDRLLLTLGAYFTSALFYQLYNHYLLANRYLYNFKITALARVVVSVCRLVLQIGAVVFYGLEGFLILEAFYILSFNNIDVFPR